MDRWFCSKVQLSPPCVDSLVIFAIIYFWLTNAAIITSLLHFFSAGRWQVCPPPRQPPLYSCNRQWLVAEIPLIFFFHLELKEPLKRVGIGGLSPGNTCTCSTGPQHCRRANNADFSTPMKAAAGCLIRKPLINLSFDWRWQMSGCNYRHV